MGVQGVWSNMARTSHKFNLGEYDTDNAATLVQVNYPAADLSEAKSIAATFTVDDGNGNDLSRTLVRDVPAQNENETDEAYEARIASVINDNANANANVTFNEATGLGTYAFTLTDSSQFDKDWYLSTGTTAADVVLYNVHSMPMLTQVEVQQVNEYGYDEFRVDWTGINLDELDRAAFYLTESKDPLETGIGLGTCEWPGWTSYEYYEIPANLPSGDYYLRAVYSKEDQVNGVIWSDDTIHYDNPNTPATAGMILGAKDQGVTGVYPVAEIVPLVVVDAYPSGVVENGGPEALCSAIRDAVDEFDCRIVNISLSTAEDSDALREAVAYAESRGVLLVASVGNDGPEGPTYYPAAYETVLAVGSAEGTEAASFSQPGADILTDGTGLRVATNRNSKTPSTVSGTSYSCAIVSGICAKLCAAYPDRTPAEIRAALFELAEDVLEPGFDALSGWGIVSGSAVGWSPFADVPTEAWCFPGVSYVYERGLMNGVGGGRFAPESSATRAMIVTLLWRMEGEPETENEPSFEDVPPDSWYADAVRWAGSEGIVDGYSAECFAPDDNVSREQLAAILWRYICSKAADPIPAENADLDIFTDSGHISPWAYDGMQWAVGAGLIAGMGNDALCPQADATRAQTATMLMRFEDILQSQLQAAEDRSEAAADDEPEA